jgi:predicted protein tyrosine phosphatase
MNLLFICSRNKWRSRTAEIIFKNDPTHHVKSAGTDDGAKVRVNEKNLDWADIIFVMEDKHKQRIKEKFNTATITNKIVVLEIPDDYQYMDLELIDIIKTSVSPYLI